MFRAQTKQESIAQAYREKVVVFPHMSGATAAKPTTLEETLAAQRMRANQHDQPREEGARLMNARLHKNRGSVKRSSKTTPPQAPSRRAGQKGSRGASPRSASKRDSPRSSEKRRPFNDYTARPYPRNRKNRK